MPFITGVHLSDSDTFCKLTKIITWTSNCTHKFIRDAICHIWLNGVLTYRLLKFGHAWELHRSFLSEYNTLRPRQNGRHIPDDIFKYIFLDENVLISAKISLKLVPEGPINDIPALVHIMALRRPADKPLSEPMIVRLPTHICVTLPQWVKYVSMP